MKYFYLLLLICSLSLAGCGSSKETSEERTSITPSPSETIMLQKQIADLKSENRSLKEQISKLEQNSRTATARAAELETQLAELKENPPVISAQPLSPPPPSPTTNTINTNISQTYEDGLKLFRERNYEIAIGVFQGIIDGGNEGELEGNCHYWLGECSYALKKYKDAISHLTKVSGFQNSKKRDDAQLMIANCYLALGNKTKAKAEYKKLIEEYPASPYVKYAKAKLKSL